jgi:hypothetical protein
MESSSSIRNSYVENVSSNVKGVESDVADIQKLDVEQKTKGIKHRRFLHISGQSPK